MSNAATTETRTEYGVRFPNGEITWTSTFYGTPLVDVVKNSRVPNLGYGTQSAREVLNAKLIEQAETVSIDPVVFVAGHSILTRQVLTVTMGHDVALTLDAIPKKKLDPEF